MRRNSPSGLRTRFSIPSSTSVWPASRRSVGFTLVEALISSFVMAFAAMAMAGMYFASLQSSSAQAASVQVDSLLRSRMELLLSEKFDSPNLVDGSQQATIDGKTYVVSWTVSGVDLDGDGEEDADAKTIVVSVEGRSATMLIVNSSGALGKI